MGASNEHYLTVMMKGITVKRPKWVEGKARTITVRALPTVRIPMDAGLWSGGSRDQYFNVPVRNNEGTYMEPLHNAMLGPFDRARVEKYHEPTPGMGVLVRHDFAGKVSHTLIVHHSDFIVYHSQFHAQL